MRDLRIRYLSIVLGLSVLFGGCSHFKSSPPNDAAITSTIEAKLYQDPALKTQDVHVLVQNGVVSLTGTVANGQQRASVEQLASGASGVKQVMNQLAVAAPAAAPAAAETTAASTAPAQPRPRQEQPARHTSRPSAEQVSNATSQPAPPPEPAAPPQPAETQAQTAPAAEPPAPVSLTIPAGTMIPVRTIDTIDSSKDHAGQELSASIASPVVVNGQVVIPQNADARLRLVSVESAGHFKGQSEVQVRLVSVSANGASYPVETAPFVRKGASRGKRSAETIGGGAGLGALIGALAGHGKGAAIGAAIGAGAGTAAQQMTKAQAAVIPSESRIDFTLSAPVTVTMQP